MMGVGSGLSGKWGAVVCCLSSSNATATTP